MGAASVTGTESIGITSYLEDFCLTASAPLSLGGLEVKSFRWHRALTLGFILIPAPWDFIPLLVPPLHAETKSQSPRTWSKTPMIRLPIHIDERMSAGLRELKLYVKPPGGQWTCAQTAPVKQTSFDYRAEKDGEYAFMFVTVDSSGRKTPANLDSRPPHQIIVVDTVPPELGVQPLPVANRDIFLQCQMHDANPDWSSVRMEYLAGNDEWHKMEVAHSDSPAVFRIPHSSVLEGKVRVSAKDKAGNVSQRIVDLGDPTQSAAASSARAPAVLPVDVNKADVATGQLIQAPDRATIQVDHKAPGKTADTLDITIPEVQPVPSKSNYNTTRSKPLDKPDQVVVPEPIPAAEVKNAVDQNLLLPADTKDATVKGDPYFPPIDAKPAPKKTVTEKKVADTGMAKQESDGATAPAAVGQGGHPIIATTHCTLDYAVENVIVGGLPKMEFWATKDSGRSWSRVVDESAGRSPAKLLLPGDGLFGIRIKANSNGQSPQTGEAPDTWIEVDTIVPTVRLLPPVLGTGGDIGTLTIQWLAHDKNLNPESINIYHASRPNGPWLPIATGLRNDGSYRWLIPAGIGPDVYLRLEATDRAGNVGRCDLNDPVAMPQPKVRVLSIGAAR